jgi:hypothetical protein
LAVYSKVIEKATHSRFKPTPCMLNNTLFTELRGFGEGISTANVAFSLTDSAFESIHEKEMHVAAIFCGLAKTFDCVKHEILLAINFCVIQGVSKDWIRSYLINRRQKVDITVKNFFFEWGTLKYGVPPCINSRASVVHHIYIYIYI